VPPLRNPAGEYGVDPEAAEAAEAAEACLEAAELAFATKLETDRDGAPEALDVLALVAFSTASLIAVSTAFVNNPIMYSRSCPNSVKRRESNTLFLAMVAGVTASDTSSTERLSSPGKYRKTNSIKDGSSVCDTLGTLAFAIYLLLSLNRWAF
jgi:hypothetical protein